MLSLCRRLQLILVPILGMLLGCDSPSHSPQPDDGAYFPLQQGDYWLYQVTQENYSLTAAPIKRVFQLKELVTGSYQQQGQVFFLLEESIRVTDQSDWQLSGRHTVSKSPTELISLDHNVPTLRLVFPVSVTTSWNLNTYNARSDTLLRYREQGNALTVGSRRYNQTITVVGQNDSTLVGQYTYRQVYAPAIGLVYAEKTSLDFCQSSPDCLGKGQIVAGSRHRQALVASNRLL